MPFTLDDLRRYAVAAQLFRRRPRSRRALQTILAFVQADPIRAPARAQDLTLRHRVRNYRAGDLERRYSALGIRRGLLRQLRFRAARGARADASARGVVALAMVAESARAGRCWTSCASAVRCIRARSMRTSSHGTSYELLGWFVERDHAPARRACTTAACCAWRGARRHPHLRACTQYGRATSTPPRRRSADRCAGRRHLLAQVRAAASARACRSRQTACATPCRNGESALKRCT